MLTAIIAAAICAAATGPFILDALLCGRRAARLRLAERVQAERQTGFVNGCGPVRRADIWDVRAAEDRLARTAWRARINARRRSCPAPRPKHDGPLVIRRRRDCAQPEPPANWWPTFPAPAPRPGLTPLEAIVADLREMGAA